jgi:hypothetical protein
LIKLFLYELKRLLINKFFIGLLIITCIFSWQTLSGDIILGVANTAPFSAWSFGVYLGKVAPLLVIALLFFITFLYSGKEKLVQSITKATPIHPTRYQLVRCGAIAVGFFALSAVAVGISFVFYFKTFQFSDFGNLCLPALLIFLPVFAFFLGLGMTVGRSFPPLLYVMMILVLILGQISLPYTADLFGTEFYQSFPLTLPLGADGEPAFVVPASFCVGKALYLVTGIILFVMAKVKKKR